MSSLFNNLKNLFWKRIHPQSRSFERRICAQTQDLQIFKKFYVSNESERSFPQHYILSLTTVHSRSLPLKSNRYVKASCGWPNLVLEADVTAPVKIDKRKTDKECFQTILYHFISRTRPTFIQLQRAVQYTYRLYLARRDSTPNELGPSRVVLVITYLLLFRISPLCVSRWLAFRVHYTMYLTLSLLSSKFIVMRTSVKTRVSLMGSESFVKFIFLWIIFYLVSSYSPFFPKFSK